MSAPSDPRAGSGRRFTAKALLASVAVLLLAVASGGLFGYLAVRDLHRANAPCDFGCLPPFERAPIEKALAGHGFDCDTDDQGWPRCGYRPPHADYEVRFQLADDGKEIEAVDITVSSAPGLGDETKRENFMAWVTAQVYAGDPATAATIDRWLRQRIASGTTSKAELGEYAFDFTAGDRSDRLWIRAVAP